MSGFLAGLSGPGSTGGGALVVGGRGGALVIGGEGGTLVAGCGLGGIGVFVAGGRTGGGGELVGSFGLGGLAAGALLVGFGWGCRTTC